MFLFTSICFSFQIRTVQGLKKDAFLLNHHVTRKFTIIGAFNISSIASLVLYEIYMKLSNISKWYTYSWYTYKIDIVNSIKCIFCKDTCSTNGCQHWHWFSFLSSSKRSTSFISSAIVTSNNNIKTESNYQSDSTIRPNVVTKQQSTIHSNNATNFEKKYPPVKSGIAVAVMVVLSLILILSLIIYKTNLRKFYFVLHVLL